MISSVILIFQYWYWKKNRYFDPQKNKTWGKKWSMIWLLDQDHFFEKIWSWSDLRSFLRRWSWSDLWSFLKWSFQGLIIVNVILAFFTTKLITFRPLIPASKVRRGRDLHFWKEVAETIVAGRTACLDRRPCHGHLAPASEVAGGHTLPF
jgi:hypothetical protein